MKADITSFDAFIVLTLELPSCKSLWTRCVPNAVNINVYYKTAYKKIHTVEAEKEKMCVRCLVLY